MTTTVADALARIPMADLLQASARIRATRTARDLDCWRDWHAQRDHNKESTVTLDRVDGVDLHIGSVVVDIAGGEHRIDGFKPYPGRFYGDHARVAYGDRWERTVGDHEPFHCLPDDEDGVDRELYAYAEAADAYSNDDQGDDWDSKN